MSPGLPDVVVEGVALWAPRLPGWDVARAVIRGEQPAPGTSQSRPAPTLLAPTERHRAPDTVAVALEVAARACEAAKRPPSELPSVFASTHGDLAISDYMCATLADAPALISPIRFHNSVHNAAAGYWSIGTGSHAAYTAISAFRHTFGTGLLEAAAQVACERKPVLYVAFDVEAKGALATIAPSRGLLGVALVLAPQAGDQAGDQAGSCSYPPSAIRDPLPNLALRVESADAVHPTAPRSVAADLLSGNALAPCLPLFEALANQESTTVTLALGERAALRVQLNWTPCSTM